MNLRAHAKINLTLDILAFDAATGYHEIQIVYREVPELFDEIEIQEADEISVECAGIAEKENLAYKAAKLLREISGAKKGARISIVKSIPIRSGLGGGSSDAAAVLKGLNRLWRLDFSKDRLAEIAAKIGMDCPFFIYGGTALGSRFGEVIARLPALPAAIKIDIVPTGVEIGTREAYKKIDLQKCGKNKSKTAELIEGLKSRDKEKILANLHNDFELFIAPHSAEARRFPPERLHLTGSGGALFAAR